MFGSIWAFGAPQRVKVEIASSDMSKQRRSRVLQETFLSRNCRIIITSYQVVSNMAEEFAGHAEAEWDYVILDEGHAIKNPTTKTSKAMHMLRSKHRLLLSGTPIQNHLTEFWALVVSGFYS
jgi:SNF2 family DNA or RNA helicase